MKAFRPFFIISILLIVLSSLVLSPRTARASSPEELFWFTRISACYEELQGFYDKFHEATDVSLAEKGGEDAPAIGRMMLGLNVAHEWIGLTTRSGKDVGVVRYGVIRRLASARTGGSIPELRAFWYEPLQSMPRSEVTSPAMIPTLVHDLAYRLTFVSEAYVQTLIRGADWYQARLQVDRIYSQCFQADSESGELRRTARGLMDKLIEADQKHKAALDDERKDSGEPKQIIF